MDSLVTKNIDIFTKSERFMDTLMRFVAQYRALITPKDAHVKHHLNKIEDQNFLVHRLLQEFLETTYLLLFAVAKVETVVPTLLTRTPSKNDSDEEC